MYNQAGYARIQSIPQLTMTNVLTILNTATSTGSVYGALTVAGGVGIGGNVYIGSAASPVSLLLNGAPLTTSAAFNGGTITGKMYVQNSGDSASVKTNNAVAVDGAVYASNFYLNGSALSTSTVWTGGTVTGAVNITNATASIGTTTGALIVGGGVGVKGPIYATGFYDQGQRPIGVGPTFSAISSSTQAIASGAFAKVNFNSVNWDTNSAAYSTTNMRWVPTVPGFYQITAGVRTPTTAAATGFSQIAIFKNGAVYRTGNTVPNSVTNPGETTVSAIIDILTAGTDFIEIYLYQNSGSSMTIPGGTTSTYFTGCYLRPYTLDSTF
jgi:hypothetical protein